MKKTNILVLGNDPQINEIKFDKLRPDTITLGINRIWLKHIPNYFFFNDYDIIQELNSQPELLAKLRANSIIFSSDWLKLSGKSSFPPWVRIIPRLDKYSFPDSVTTAISLFKRNYLKSTNYTFYIAGVSLKWQEPSHFWKQLDYTGSLNLHGENWYSPRFEKIAQNFRILKNSETKMISVNPNSNLNKMMRYENIANLYSK